MVSVETKGEKITFVVKREPCFWTWLARYFQNLQKYEYQEQKAEVEVIGADGSIFVSDIKKGHSYITQFELNPQAVGIWNFK